LRITKGMRVVERHVQERIEDSVGFVSCRQDRSI
jgi:hypothetical protein